MEDDFSVVIGEQTVTFAADAVDGKYYQRVKLASGADGVASEISASNPLPVSLHGTFSGLSDAQLRAAPVTVTVGNFPSVQPVSVSGSVAVTGGLSNAELRASPLPVSGTVDVASSLAAKDGGLAAIPAGTTNGTPLSGRPANANGVAIYIPDGASVTFTIATAQPGSAPAYTLTLDHAHSPVFETLGPGTNIYVTAATGLPLYRWI